MNRDDLFPSKYFKAEDLPRAGLPVKIEGVTFEPIGQDQKTKGIVSFTGQKKSLVLNATNFDAVVDVLGISNTDDWGGHTIVLYPTKTQFAGKSVPCIRVKEHHQPAPVTAKPQLTEIDPPPQESVPADHDQDEEEF
jgi:hypothetical protein